MAVAKVGRPFQREIFLSYAHRDKYWMERLRMHLKPLEKSCGAEVFWDGVIDAGTDWHEQIQQHLHSANAAVLLISADFLASKYISNNEFPALLGRAMEKRTDLNAFLVYVGPCCYEEVAFEYTLTGKQKTRQSLSRIMAVNDPATPLICQTACEQEHMLVVVARKIAEWFRELDHPPVGPKRGPATTTNKVNVSRMPRSSSFFAGRDNELQHLERHFQKSKSAVYEIVAQGGEGRSALVSHWLRQRESKGWDGSRVFAWSFYSQGTREASTAADDFIFEALKHFGESKPVERPPVAKGIRLARLIQKQTKKSILVLDGLEPLQDRKGFIQDEAVAALVATLAKASGEKAFCVITTRQRVAIKSRQQKPRRT
jgi:hypothetical protein